MTTSWLYETLSVIKAWHGRPSEYGLCKPAEDLSFMAAYERTSAKISEVINGTA